MRRSAWIFLAAILLPSLVLAWMAVRSARDQQVILEHQQAIICQDITDTLAKQIQDQVDSSRLIFMQTTDQLLRQNSSPQRLATHFNQQLQRVWNLAEVGFAVDLRGAIYSPNPREGVEARTFRNENDRFLSNRENVPVFAQAPPKSKNAKVASFDISQDVGNQVNQAATPPQTSRQGVPPAAQIATQNATQPRGFDANQNSTADILNRGLTRNQAQSPQVQRAQSSDQNRSSNTVAIKETEGQAAQVQKRGSPSQPSNRSELSNNSMETQTANQAAQQQVAPQNLPPQKSQAGQGISPDLSANQAQQVQRLVEPQSNFGQNSFSNTLPEESDFRKLIGTETSGALARFLEDKLRVMVWYRPEGGPLVFGAQIRQQNLVDNLKPLLQSPEVLKTGAGAASTSAYTLVILDDRGRPAALSREGFSPDWKHPFAATEIGEALPHWEAALYLVDPRQISRSASTLQLTLGLIVAVLVAAIILGGSLMAADVRRQMRLAQQKTDFVSNVSHELKTPLTSIRMFADMLAEGRVDEHERQGKYLRIISAESARLTRLINNVLDFARMERGAPSGERRPCDLVEIVREVVDTCRPHLENVGAALAVEIGVEELPLIADRDALAQIILNLLSNAEKYGGRDILVRVRREENTAEPIGCVEVLDRGPGIPPKKRETIFEPFQRLHDSLASGVSGSGLGLTLARRMARAHGGDVNCSPRQGGGSCFTLRVPLSASEKQSNAAEAAKPGNQPA
ncbi:MAG TPA: HAMP domain-containing sensor histidine kinase [Candidatus Angelobacter sp.]